MKRFFYALVGFGLLWRAPAQAQQGELGDALSSLMNAGIIKNIVRNEPISTSIRDTDKRVDLSDSFGEGQPFRPIHRRPRSASGGYVLTPGFYELRSRSYCIKAGTHAPSNGDGYLYAPLKGRQADIVRTILAGSAVHNEIEQHDVQLLLWAIIARSDFRNMDGRVVGVATSLLNSGQLVRLNKQAILSMALSLLDSPQLEASLRPVFAAEHQLRQAFGQLNASFADMERLAMLAGPALVDNPDIRRGRWSKHPDGYYVRYFPQHYSRTIIQLYVPDNLPTVTFDATDDVAVPANTGAQRLALSNVPYDTTGYLPEEPPLVVAQAPVPAPVTVAPPPLPGTAPPAVTYQRLCGTVLDAQTRVSIAGATVRVGDQQLTTDEYGQFRIDKLTLGQSVELLATAEHYKPDRLSINMASAAECQSVVLNLEPIPLPPTGRTVTLDETAVREGDRIVLENIQFEQSRSDLLPDGKAELTRVVAWMKVHESAIIELSGHTSNEGDESANLVLSKQRAASCKRYLLQKGVAPDRIKAVGYGQAHPIVSNETPERAKNRRVEMKVEQL